MKRYSILSLVLIFLFLIPAHISLAENTEETPYVTTIYNERNGLPTGEANAICQTQDHYVWIGSYGGLVRYDGTTFRNFSQEGKFPSSSVRSLFEDSQGRLWIGTNDAGLFLFENDSFTHIPEEGDPVFLSVRDIAEDQQGRIWAACTSGLARVENGMLQPVNDPLLSGQIIYSLGIDANGRVWCALDGWQCAVVSEKGVALISSASIFPDGQQIYCVSSDKDGSIYLGTYQNAVAKLTFSASKQEAAPMRIDILETGNTTMHNAMSVTPDGDLFVCGQRGFAWVNTDGHLRTFDETTGAANLNDAMLDYEGNLWLASSSYGVIKFNPGCFHSLNRNASLDGIAFNTITCSNGHYYLGMDNGLIILDGNWQPIENELTALMQNTRIRHVITDGNGAVWLATYSSLGTICYQPDTGHMTLYNADIGMRECFTRTLLERKDGTIAAGTSDGFYLLRDGRVLQYFGSKDGLLNTTVLCFAEDESGTLYIGTDGGGMYSLTGDTLTLHGSNEGLKNGIVLRILPDGQRGLFVSAGSHLYHWKDHSFRVLDHFEKAAGNIFDMYLVNDKLYLLQNSGVLEVDAARLMQGQKAETTLYSFQHGLTGSLNANTWHHLTADQTLYMATRSGISVFAFAGVDTPLPTGMIQAVQADQTVYEHPTSLTLPSDTHRITIDFASLSYAETDQSIMSYQLAGFSSGETLVTDQKNGSISYTNLPGGDYVFHLRIYHPESPDEGREYLLPIHIEKKITEQPLFWVLFGLAVIALLTFIIFTISQLRHRAHVRRIQERQRELQAILHQSLQSFAMVIDAKDPYTKGHSSRVARYARELARRMHLSSDEQERIYYIALLHDIGKIGIPDHILNKQGPLTPEEKKIVKTHPEVGGHVLEGFTALEGIADGARYHHERYDGNGYCAGKKGTDIPLVARIIGVADSYDTMSSDRCYRAALSKEKIISELKENAGTQFDPAIVPFMLAMIEDGTVPSKEDNGHLTLSAADE
ncbi:MAG: HD domain-containing protein [Clostridia bacterium]|nr:HD domain-containing protein [Clostridia bacterium]